MPQSALCCRLLTEFPASSKLASMFLSLQGRARFCLRQKTGFHGPVAVFHVYLRGDEPRAVRVHEPVARVLAGGTVPGFDADRPRARVVPSRAARVHGFRPALSRPRPQPAPPRGKVAHPAENPVARHQRAGRGKLQIIFSHSPYKATGQFRMEVDYLTDLKYNFIKDGWVWRAVK